MDQATYFKTWEALSKHLISEEQWQEFCRQVLAELE